MATYLGWETSISLLLAYETLALNHKNTLNIEEKDKITNEVSPYFIYKNGFALLILNASIIEGTMRTILSMRVKKDLDDAVERGNSEGRGEHDSPTRLLAKFLVELESSGGWQNLIGASKSYLGERLDEGVDVTVRNGVEVLFTLRNVLAHGTALIQPKTKMSEDMKDDYPYSWQSKLHGVAMYLDLHFKRGGIFENLAHPDCAKHFMEITKSYFIEVEKRHSQLLGQSGKTIGMIKEYSFGFRYWH